MYRHFLDPEKEMKPYFLLTFAYPNVLFGLYVPHGGMMHLHAVTIAHASEFHTPYETHLEWLLLGELISIYSCQIRMYV